MSTHSVDVVPIVLEEHPDADSLSIVQIGGWQVCVRTADWQDRTMGAYVEPDYEVPLNRDEFAFLRDPKRPNKNWSRIKVKRLRGVLSCGLLVPAPEGSKVGDNVMEQLGVRRYEPPVVFKANGADVSAPPGWYPKYDVENYQKYTSQLVVGEEVIVTEKLHGANARFTAHEGELYVGSRTRWKQEDETNPWWRAVAAQPWIKEFCLAHPDLTLYGEIFGQVQNLKYGAGPNQIFFRVFDILKADKWLSYDDARDILLGFTARTKGEDTRDALDILAERWVPQVYRGPFNKEVIDLASGKSLIPGADNIREGIVIRPKEERYTRKLGRVFLKVVSEEYFKLK